MFFKSTSQKIVQWEADRKGDKIIKLLDQPDSTILREAIRALERLQNISAVPALIQLKRHPDVQNDVSKALEAIALNIFLIIETISSTATPTHQEKTFLSQLPILLHDIGRPAMRAAQKSLHNKSAQARRLAIQILGDFHASHAIPHIINRLSDENNDVRQTAVQVLKQFDSTLVQTAIEHCVNNEKTVFITVAASLVRQLVKVPQDTPTAINFFIAVRDFKSLRTCGDAAIEPVVNQLDHYDPDIQQACLHFLENSDEAAIPVLIKTLQAEEFQKRSNALKILNHFKLAETIIWNFKKLLDVHEQVRKVAMQGIEENKEAAIKLFNEKLVEKDGLITASLIQVFIKMGWKPTTQAQRIALAIIQHDWKKLLDEGKAAVEEVCFFLEKIPKDETDCILQALSVLEQLHDSRAIPVVLVHLKQGTVMTREKAIFILEQLMDKKTVKQLETCLGEPDDDIRCLIAKTMKKHGYLKWDKAIHGTKQDFIDLAMLGNKAAIERLIQIVQGNDEAWVKQAGEALIQLAEKKPNLLVKHWKLLYSVLSAPHVDTHSDVDFNRSSDCTHDDSHSDFGFSSHFPENPPPQKSGQKDF